jgi:hypothetical protein
MKAALLPRLTDGGKTPGFSRAGETYFPAMLKSVARALLFGDFEGITDSQ